MTLSRLAPLVFVACAFGCRNKEAPPAEQAAPKTPPSEERTPTASEQAATKPEAQAPPGLPPKNPYAPPGSMNLVGPELWITPGKGVGAVFFGAYEETASDRLEGPCDLTKEETKKSADGSHAIKRCAYVERGLELTFEDGALSQIHIHRRDREVRGFDTPEKRFYGTFKGGIAPKTVIGLHKHIVEEEFGKPKNEENLEEKGPDGLVSLGHYPGVTLEYDLLKNGNTVLSGFIIEPDEKSKRNIKRAQEEKAGKKPG